MILILQPKSLTGPYFHVFIEMSTEESLEYLLGVSEERVRGFGQGGAGLRLHREEHSLHHVQSGLHRLHGCRRLGVECTVHVLLECR